VFLSPAAGHPLSRVTGSSLHDFFDSTAFEIARDLALFTVAVFWLGLAYWVYRDARRRIDDVWLVGTATLLGLVPFLGPLVYLLFRPPETLDDARARAVEIRALEARLSVGRPECPVCRSGVEPNYLVCPVCTTQLRSPCVKCSAPLEPLWQACPFCATPVGAAAVDLEGASLDGALTAALVHGAAPRRRQAKNRRAAAG
jgi:hypothetical protein